jgi:hypothetical protein
VSNDNFRRELGHVFDEMAGTPSAALPDRVRSSIAHTPEQRGPYWIAGLAAALIAAVVIGVLVVANPLNRPANTIAPGLGSSPTPSAPASPVATGPAFSCGDSGTVYDYAQAPGQAVISDLRTDSHPGYDRLTIQLTSGGLTDLQFHVQAGTVFTRSPRGDQVTLAGTNGILVVIQGADLHTAYTGSTDIKTGLGSLVEVRQVEDFEGVVQLALGVSGSPCYRAYQLTDPHLLYIDVQAP